MSLPVVATFAVDLAVAFGLVALTRWSYRKFQEGKRTARLLALVDHGHPPTCVYEVNPPINGETFVRATRDGDGLWRLRVGAGLTAQRETDPDRLFEALGYKVKR